MTVDIGRVAGSGKGIVRRLDRYVLGQIWLPAVLASLVIVVVVAGGAIQQQVRELLKAFPIAQVTMWDISRLSVYSLPAIAGYVVPITFLIGIMLAFGRMAEQSELIAMKAAGIPLKRVAAPVIILGAALSALCFVAQDQGQAWAYRSVGRLFSSELPLRITIDMLPTGAVHEYGGWRVYVGRRDEAGDLRDIVIVQPQEDGQVKTFYADGAGLRADGGERWIELRQGFFIKPSQQGEKMVRLPFDRLKMPIPSLAPPPKPADRKSMTLYELIQAERVNRQQFETSDEGATGKFAAGIECYNTGIEIGKRLSFPLMCLTMSIAGAAMGARSRRAGRSFAFAGGLILVGAYFVLRKAVEPSIPLPVYAMVLLAEIPNLTIGAIGAAMLGRVDRL